MSRSLAMLAPRASFEGSSDYFGKHFASFYFFSSLVRSGLFDDIHVYAASYTEQMAVEAALKQSAPDGLSRVKTFLLFDLPAALTRESYEIFYLPDLFPYFADICNLRQKYQQKFRVIGGMASISYATMEADILRILLSAVQPDDVILCSSQCGFQSLLRLVAHVRYRFDRDLPFNVRMVVVPFGIDTKEFQPRDQGSARTRLGLSPTDSYVLSLARFSIEDKFDYGPLIEAFRLAVPRMPGNWQLLLAGGVTNRDYFRYLEQLIGDRELSARVKLFPDFDNSVKPDLYAAADLFVCPSDNFQETFGLSVIEAMASGLPTIVSDWNGFKDTVAHEVTGLRIPTYMPQLDSLLSDRQIYDNSLVHLLSAQALAVDLPGLAQAFVSLAQDEPLRRKMGTAARDRAVELYDYASVVQQLAAVLDHQLGAEEPNQPLDYLLPDLTREQTPWNLFAHYSTRALRAADRVRTTEFGLESLRHQVPLFICPEMEEFLYADLLRPMCRYGEGGRSLIEIASHFGGGQRDGERIIYSVYWLLKQGLLALEN